jgi:hypothetical protein
MHSKLKNKRNPDSLEMIIGIFVLLVFLQSCFCAVSPLLSFALISVFSKPEQRSTIISSIGLLISKYCFIFAAKITNHLFKAYKNNNLKIKSNEY